MTNSFPPNSQSPFQFSRQNTPAASSAFMSARPEANTQSELNAGLNSQSFGQPQKKAPPKKWVAGIVGVALLLTGGYFWAKEQGLLPDTGDLVSFSFFSPSQVMFIPGAGLSQSQAQTLYQQSLISLKNQQPQEALKGFNQLEKSYPGLLELILLRQAEAYASLGEENHVQGCLKRLLSQFSYSPLALRAKYLMAQSHFRANEKDKAKQAFLSLHQKFPKSDFGIGSSYYLGLLASDNPASARSYWLSYLKQCPKCRFSGDSAEALQNQIDTGVWKGLHPTENLYIGIGLAASDRQWDKALAHLQNAPLAQSWFYLAKAWIQKQQPEKAEQVFQQGLLLSQDIDQSQEAIDWLIKRKSLPVLETLNSVNLPYKGDYLLWQLAQLKPETATGYYQQIVTRYPKGDYAPESSWNLLWPLIESAQYQAFLEQSEKHMAQYPYARSTPKVQFWIAKSYEKLGSSASAKAAYEALATQYAGNYYAFRAKGRLQALNGQIDMAWSTALVSYQPKSVFNTIRILPSWDAFSKQYRLIQGNTVQTLRTYRALEELQKIGASDDLLLLSEAALKKVPPTIASWAYQQNNERPRGLRIIRDSLQERLKVNHQLLPTRDEQKLLYPVYFAPLIATNSQQFSVDPYVIQGLMREESYFNEMAVSGSNARGLMQLLPSTAKDVAGWENMPGFNELMLFSPDVNIHLGTRYLKFLHEQFNDLPASFRSMAAVGAYNGGPNAMRRWVQANPHFTQDPDLFVEEIPYEQTRDYIKKVFGSAWNYQSIYATP